MDEPAGMGVYNKKEVTVFALLIFVVRFARWLFRLIITFLKHLVYNQI